MSCPDWQGLAALRLDGGEPAEWPAALAHLDGCSACRETAPAADPALLFRRLPAVELAADEVEEMRRQVEVLRRSRRLEPPRRRGRGGMQRAASLAGLLAGAAMLVGGGSGNVGLENAGSSVATSLPEELAYQPMLEEIDQPFDQVVQWDAEDFSMVLVVDQRLDV